MDRGDVIDGRFQILELAGSGGMGRIYRARDERTGKLVALKLLLPRGSSLRSRFDSEALLLSSLSHDAIVRYVAHGEARGRSYLAMEWLSGEDLSTRLSRSLLTPTEAIELGLRAAAALGHAHRCGVVHCDIKPANLFLVDGHIERLKVIDFGLALSTGTDGQQGPPGTPGYMAPEQALGDCDVDARADVFALGCVLYRCLTGKSPFEGEHLAAVLARTLLETPTALTELRPDVSPVLEALVVRLLAKAPADRLADGTEVASALLRVVPGELSARVLERASPSLTEREQQVVSLLLVGASREPADGDAARIKRRGATLGARVEHLADGSSVVLLAGDEEAAVQAARASRCALAINALGLDAPMAIVTGRGDLGGGLPVGEVIDCAASLLGRCEAGEIVLDDVTAGLLGGNFQIDERAAPSRLIAEWPSPRMVRTLLGRPSPFVGRTQELSLLDANFARCVRDQQPVAVLLSAPAGFGKSRLRHEWQERLRQHVERPLVLIARGDPMSVGSPFGMLSQIVRQVAQVEVGEPIAVRREKLLRCAQRMVELQDAPRVAAFLGELSGSSFEHGEAPELGVEGALQLSAAREDPMLMGDQMLRAWEALLLAESENRPLVLVLEDLHWGDFPTVKYIDAALRLLRGRRLFVLALGRPELLDAFPRLWAERGVVPLGLTALDVAAGARLVREVLGLGSEEAARMSERSAGNALYLEELIRARASGKGDAWPDTVLAMVQARLSGLGALERKALRAASIFGQVFWASGVSALLGGRGAEQVGSLLAGLVAEEIVELRAVSKFPGQREYGFRHALVSEAAYASLTEDDRALGHRLAALWLERAGEVDAMVLAEHFERGKEPRRAVTFYGRAAEQALEGNDFEAVVARAERGVRCGAAGEACGQLRLLQAEAHMWRGEGVQAQVCGLLALQMLPDASSGWFSATGLLASLSAMLGNSRLLLATTELLLRAKHEASAQQGARVVAISQASLQLLFDGDTARAKALLALLPPEPSDAPAVLAWVHRAKAQLAMSEGDIEASVKLTEAAVEHYRRAGDLRNACAQLANAGSARNEVGCYEQAERLLREAAQVAERLGLAPAVATAQMNMGLSLAMQGRLSEAEDVERQAIRTFEAIGHRRLVAGARSYLATILLLSGNTSDAESAAREALDVGNASAEGLGAQGVLAAVLLTRGAAREALMVATQAVDAIERIGALDEGESPIRLVHAEALAQCGQHDEARMAIGRAHASLMARAERVSDPALRAIFLACARGNARILALAEQWGVR